MKISTTNNQALQDNINKDLQEKMKLELLKEELQLSTETVEKGTVRLIKKVHENEQPVNVSLTSTNIGIEKIPVNQIVDSAPGIRYEGDVMIVPILKEVLVTEKKLMLVEEWHISQKTTSTEHSETITLREEELIIERIPSDISHQ